MTNTFTDDALGELDAVGLTEAMRSRQVSVGEVIDAAIARCEAADQHLAAVAVDRFAAARADARRPAPGFFSGVPSFIKDNTDLAGLPTQQGTASFVGKPKPTDGDVARSMRAQGFIMLGKTRLSEFGFSGAAEYVEDDPVRNPWHLDHTSGASSAGAAALVAAGVVPIAHANDGGGSIRIPASCCGLVGMKPTRNRTPSDAVTRNMPLRIVADGVLTRTVRDTAAFLRESERVYRNPALPPVGDVRGPGHRRLKIGVVVDSISGTPTAFEHRQVLLVTADKLEAAGHHLEVVEAPALPSFSNDFLDYWSTFALFFMRAGKVELDKSFDPELLDNLTKGLAKHASRHAYRMPRSLSRLWGSQFVTKRFFKKYDAILTPTLGHVTPPLGHLKPNQDYETLIAKLIDWVSFTPLQNASGDPAISVPAGLSKAGLPIGVHLSAEQGHEARLLELAYELEEIQPFPRLVEHAGLRPAAGIPG